ncbi:MAG: DnaJ domain-containing protein [Candidatus Sericytochromatia bacterium]|nr:DnaJ domain-containing protein [Candidatus Tanganyikabacteria bacterium]
MEVNYYDLLEVSERASEEVIRAAFKVLQKRAHPDRGGDTRISQILNNARDTLLDPARRRQYDASLARAAPEPAEPVAERIIRQIVEVRVNFVVCMHCRALNRIAEQRLDRAPGGKCGKCGKRFAEPEVVERDVFFAVCLACGQRTLVESDDYRMIRELTCKRCEARISGEAADHAAARAATAPQGPQRRPAIVREYRLRAKGLELGMHLPGFQEGVWEASDLFARMKGATLKLTGKLAYGGRKDSRHVVVRVSIEENEGMGSIATAAEDITVSPRRQAGFALALRIARPDAKRARRLVLGIER